MKILLSNCLLTYVQRLSHSLVVVFWIPSLLTKVVFNVDEENFPVLLSTRTIKQNLFIFPSEETSFRSSPPLCSSSYIGSSIARMDGMCCLKSLPKHIFNSCHWIIPIFSTDLPSLMPPTLFHYSISSASKEWILCIIANTYGSLWMLP